MIEKNNVQFVQNCKKNCKNVQDKEDKEDKENDDRTFTSKKTADNLCTKNYTPNTQQGWPQICSGGSVMQSNRCW